MNESPESLSEDELYARLDHAWFRAPLEKEDGVATFVTEAGIEWTLNYYAMSSERKADGETTTYVWRFGRLVDEQGEPADIDDASELLAALERLREPKI